MFSKNDIVVKRGSIHQDSRSFSLWRVLSVLSTTIPCIEVAPISKQGRLVMARAGVYAEQQFDHATEEEIQLGKRIHSKYQPRGVHNA